MYKCECNHWLGIETNYLSWYGINLWTIRIQRFHIRNESTRSCRRHFDFAFNWRFSLVFFFHFIFRLFHFRLCMSFSLFLMLVKFRKYSTLILFDRISDSIVVFIIGNQRCLTNSLSPPVLTINYNHWFCLCVMDFFFVRISRYHESRTRQKYIFGGRGKNIQPSRKCSASITVQCLILFSSLY